MTKIPKGFEATSVKDWYKCKDCGCDHVHLSDLDNHTEVHNTPIQKADQSRARNKDEYLCTGCGENLANLAKPGCFCGPCSLYKPRDLTLEQYWEILKLMRYRIWSGRSLQSEDSTTICTWGFCSNDIVAFPKPEYHIWPLEYTRDGRVALLHRPKDWYCPMEYRNGEGFGDVYGCFYRCRIFTRKKEEKEVDIHQALKLYDEAIKEVEKTLCFGSG